eukprot:g4977.t1
MERLLGRTAEDGLIAGLKMVHDALLAGKLPSVTRRCNRPKSSCPDNVSWSDVKEAKALVKRGGGTRKLIRAVQENDLCSMVALLEAGANPNKVIDGVGRNKCALHLAASMPHRRDAICYMVLDGGGDAKRCLERSIETSGGGMAALHYAAKGRGTAGNIATLLSLGADVNVKSDYGLTPLDIALKYNDDPTVEGVLRSNGGRATGAKPAFPIKKAKKQAKPSKYGRPGSPPPYQSYYN